MKLETLKTSELKPLESNVRRHTEKQVSELVRSVKQFGQTRAIVIDENNNIMIGNGLHAALTQMGVETCDCYRVVGLNDTQKKKLILADNKTFQLGSDDYDTITKYINDIANVGDFDIAGFDESALRQLTASMEDSLKEIEDYGVIKDEKLVATANEEPSIAQQPSTPIQTEEAYKPQQKVERKKIICPNCGEVIYLD